VGQGWVKDVDAETAKAKGVAAGMVKDADGGKEVHNLSRGCRDYKKYTGKNNNSHKAMNMVNNRSEYRLAGTSRDSNNKVYLPHCC
jgi:hypothetical protein